MRGTEIEKEVEIYATNIANQTKCVSTNAYKNGKMFVKAYSALLNRVGVASPPHLWTETDPVSETLCFLVSRIPNDGQSTNSQ
jgi:hypothetical protein